MDELVAEALRAMRSAYAPYSRFHVGAALRCTDARLFSGCNVENAAYPEGTCAEAGAIAAMVRAGGRRIAELVVAGGGSEPCTPCGGCRQKIREFAEPSTLVRIVGEDGSERLRLRVDALLPHAFGPDNLGQHSAD